MTDPLPDPETLEQLDSIQLEAHMREARYIKLELILRLYVIVGALVAVLSLVYFGFSFLKISLTEDQRFSLVAAGSGISIAVMSATYLAFRRQQRTVRSEDFRTASLDYDLVKEWAKFEAMGRKVLEEKGIEFNSRSPRSILTMLDSHGLIPHESAREISTALDIRNKVVHRFEPQPQILVQEAGKILANSNDKLKMMLMTPDHDRIYSTVRTGITGSSTLSGTQFSGSNPFISMESPSVDFLKHGGRSLNPDEE